MIIIMNMDTLNLTKGQVIELKKEDGTNLSKVRVWLSWDVVEGQDMDLDLFAYHKDSKITAYFNAKTAINGLVLSEDNRTGEWDGDDEFLNMDAKVTADGEYFICVNIYDAESKGQSLKNVTNAEATIYDNETNKVLAKYNMTAEWGDNTSIVVGKIIDLEDGYKFEAIWTYLKGDISQVIASV